VSWPRWTIKPEPLVAPNGAEITMGIAYGPAPEEATVVLSLAEFDALTNERDHLRWEAERRVAVMREGAARLKPLARRALTEGGDSGDQARCDLHAAIAWLGQGCPPSTTCAHPSSGASPTADSDSAVGTSSIRQEQPR
jgi:hypothetical protein